MKQAFWRWLVLVVAVFAASHLRFLGIRYDSVSSLLAAALVLSLANTFIRPLVLLLSLPLILLTLGLFLLVVNALLFYAVGRLVTGFHVPTFGSALGGSIVVSLVSLALGAGGNVARTVTVINPSRRPPPGEGPIIDV